MIATKTAYGTGRVRCGFGRRAAGRAPMLALLGVVAGGLLGARPVRAVTVTLPPVGDSWIDEAAPNANNGNDHHMHVFSQSAKLRRGIALAWLTPILLLGGTALATAALDRSPAVSRTIDVAMTDDAYGPSTLAVATGQTVRFVFRNEGTVVHEALIGDAALQTELLTHIPLDRRIDVRIRPDRAGELADRNRDAGP